MNGVIEFTGIDYTYQSSGNKALEGLSLAIEAGELIALTGATGSGKSTLLQLTAGLLLPQAGKARVLDTPLSDPKLNEKQLDALRRRVVIALQRPEDMLFETYLGDDVAYGPANYGLRQPSLALRVKEAMERVGLPYTEYKDRRCDSLSGGEKRRAALAGVLALDPEILLLDEPAAGLDAAGADRLFDLILDLHREGRTLLFSTHDMQRAAMADRVALFSRGRLIALAPPAALFAREELLDQAGILPPESLRLLGLLRKNGIIIDGGGPGDSPEELADLIAACTRSV